METAHGHWWVWSIGVAGGNARFVVLVGLSKRFEANRDSFQ